MGKYDAQARYHAAHTTRVAIRFVHSTDKDILDHLEKQPNKAGYIKSLIRADIAREQPKD